MKYTIGTRSQWTGGHQEWTSYVRNEEGAVIYTTPARNKELTEKIVSTEVKRLEAMGHSVTREV